MLQLSNCIAHLKYKVYMVFPLKLPSKNVCLENIF